MILEKYNRIATLRKSVNLKLYMIYCVGCPVWLFGWNSSRTWTFSVSAIFSKLPNFDPKIPRSILLIDSTESPVAVAIFSWVIPVCFLETRSRTPNLVLSPAGGFCWIAESCTGRLILMQNDKGDVQKCEVTANEEMMTGAFMSGLQVDRCVEQWEALGYRKAIK